MTASAEVASTDQIEAMIAAVRTAWAEMPPPPAEDLKYLAWACGEDAWRAFVNVPPAQVDTSSPAVLGCTPLLDLPPTASAAYLGTYLLVLLEGLKFQLENGVFYDILTRAHVIFCLSEPDFWGRIIRPHLPAQSQEVLAALATLLVMYRDALALSPEQSDRIVALSEGAAGGRTPPA